MGNTRPRKLSDGSLIYPKRGAGPPDPPEGYEPSTDDPYVMYPKLEDCEAREVVLVERKCCGGNYYLWKCNLTSKTTTRTRCLTCVLK
jgi:hypothetical protein